MGSSWLWAGDRQRQTPQWRFNIILIILRHHHQNPPPHHCRHNYNHNHDYAADLHRTMEQVKGDQARSQVLDYCADCGCDASD